jgi:hypothetical protein
MADEIDFMALGESDTLDDAKAGREWRRFAGLTNRRGSEPKRPGAR